MNTYNRHRFPPGIISYVVWLYYRFNLSHRDIGDLLAERGINVSYESIRPLLMPCAKVFHSVPLWSSSMVCG
jgi:transposase-like protein